MPNFSKSLDLIYEAAFQPENWPIILTDMARAVGGQGTVLFNSRAASSRWVASPEIMDLITGLIEDNWLTRNTRAERLLSLQIHGFANEAEAFSDEEYNRFPIYTELMQPLGYGFGAATSVNVPSGDNLVFSVEKKRANGPVDAKGIRYLDSLRPHLARAALLSGRLQFERINAAMEALQMTGLPSAVLMSDGKVAASNSLFQNFGPQISIAGFDQLRFAHRPASAILAEALGQINAGSNEAGSRSFPLPQLENAPPTIVHVIPVRGNARDIFLRATAFLVLTTVDRHRVPSAETIQGLFDLTPAEARVARSIAAGRDVVATALDLSLGTETIRSHIKAILSKSGLSRQTDFVAAIASLRTIE